MSQHSQTFITISCDGDGCEKAATFVQTAEGEKQALEAHPWLYAARAIQTTDGRKFTYCSDECEIKAAGAGVHNKPIIVTPQGPNDVALAAQAAEAAAKATAALKAGGKVTLG